MNLESQIEAVLFFKAEPVSVVKLANILKTSQDDIIAGVDKLRTALESRGITLQENNGEYMLVASREYSDIIEELQKEELSKDLSKASLETLSIILYKNGASRAEIDYIRGVNSSFILRALAVRGLVKKSPDPKDNRKMIFKPTFELLSFMGVGLVKELPNFDEVHASINNAAKALEDLTQKEVTENGTDTPEA